MASNNDDFQLPAFAPINFSLTEGTNIPAPPDSPPETPRPPTSGMGPLSSHPTSPVGEPKATPSDSPSNGTTDASNSHDTLDYQLHSPTQSSRRPSSVRRIFGFRKHASSDSLKSTVSRPATAAIQPVRLNNVPTLSRKKSGSWFGRRKSVLKSPEEQSLNSVPQAIPQQQPEVKKGPPPPTIPELDTFASTNLNGSGFDADDMFKNIK